MLLDTLGGRGIIWQPWFDAVVTLVAVTLIMTLLVFFIIWLERKLVGRLQMRLGPMRTGPYGTLQSIADGIKLVGKEDLRPATSDRWVFEFAPYFAFVPIFLAFVALPVAEDGFVRNLPLGLFYIVAITGLNIVGLVMAGFGSANKYAVMGGARAGAQLISYEIPLILSLLSVAMIDQTLNISAMVADQGTVPYAVLQPLAFVIFLIAGMAELHRQPFDMPVGESEVVGGALVEYSGIRWGMFFLGEYCAVIVISILGSLVFLGGWAWPWSGSQLGAVGETVWQVGLLGAKSLAMIVVIFWLRASLPRLRIDQLMAYCWKILLPVAFVQILLNGFVVVYDLPDVAFLVTSGALLLGLGYLTYISVRRPGSLKARRLVYAGRT
ncbi:MAG: NADH-quinone oxidoreductase subunit NuoH [Dehalococcoidia bacterium]|nr:NADH-quinone oxidoreductase subunit NuoH [Dehalococcoidia bacterium]